MHPCPTFAWLRLRVQRRVLNSVVVRGLPFRDGDERAAMMTEGRASTTAVGLRGAAIRTDS